MPPKFDPSEVKIGVEWIHPIKDAQDSELPSPGGILLSGMNEADLKPEYTYQPSHVSGWLSPPCSNPGSTNATQTPLPPISTFSDKFAVYDSFSNVSDIFSVMQKNGLNSNCLGLDQCEVSLPRGVGLSPPRCSPPSQSSSHSQNGLDPPQESFSSINFDSFYSQEDVLQSPALSPSSSSLDSLPEFRGLITILPLEEVALPKIQYHSSPLDLSINAKPRSETMVSATPSATMPIENSETPSAITRVHKSETSANTLADKSEMPSENTHIHKSKSPSANKLVHKSKTSLKDFTPMESTCSDPVGLKEINTVHLAQRISSELKKHKIHLRVFANRVLCRSHSTLSELLRHPKPWSKLTKIGREVYRRMWKWLQEPETTRVSALRIAVAHHHKGPGPPCSDNAQIPQLEVLSPISAGKRSGGPQMHRQYTPVPKKPRLVFTDLQQRVLQAVFKENRQPSRGLQMTLACQLGLKPEAVCTFFKTLRRSPMESAPCL